MKTRKEYLDLYLELIQQAKTLNRPKHKMSKGVLVGEYVEAHHIRPKCMNGTDDKENLVNLTYDEHFLAHTYLCLAFPNNSKLRFACKQVTMLSKGRKLSLVGCTETVKALDLVKGIDKLV